MSDIQDFTVQRSIKRFKIDDDVFECVSAIPAETTRRFVKMSTDYEGDPDRTMGAVMELLDAVMLPASAERFAERLRSNEQPITLEQVTEVVTWVMGQYAERPTQSPSGLTTSSPVTTTGGSSLMATTLAGE